MGIIKIGKRRLRKKKLEVDHYTKFNYEHLMFAIKHNYIDIVKQIIRSQKVDLNKTNK